jgi:hypothetical protein
MPKSNRGVRSRRWLQPLFLYLCTPPISIVILEGFRPLQAGSRYAQTGVGLEQLPAQQIKSLSSTSELAACQSEQHTSYDKLPSFLGR